MSWAPSAMARTIFFPWESMWAERGLVSRWEKYVLEPGKVVNILWKNEEKRPWFDHIKTFRVEIEFRACIEQLYTWKACGPHFLKTGLFYTLYIHSFTLKIRIFRPFLFSVKTRIFRCVDAECWYNSLKCFFICWANWADSNQINYFKLCWINWKINCCNIRTYYVLCKHVMLWIKPVSNVHLKYSKTILLQNYHCNCWNCKYMW